MPLKHFLQLEDSTEIMAHTVGASNLALWPMVRSPLFSYLISQHCGFERPETKPRDKGVVHSFSLYDFTQLVFFLMRSVKNIKVVYISNKSLRTTPFGMYNIYEQPTAALLPQITLYMEHSRKKEISLTTTDFTTQYTGTLHTLIVRCSRILRRILFKKSIKLFCDFLHERSRQLFPDVSIDKDNFAKTLTAKAAITILEYYVFRVFLQKIKPQAIFIPTASYGDNLGIVRAANDLGIATCELQHGIVYNNHYAYNCAHSLQTSDIFSAHYPKFFLSYGEFWRSGISTPTSIRTLGNPYFTMQKEMLPSTPSDGILFALANNYTDFIPIIAETRKQFPKRTIIVRPHPNQKHYASVNSLIAATGCAIDKNPEIYTTLNKVNVVIGTASTSLFEAACLSKQCFIKPSKITEKCDTFSIFESIYSAKDLETKLTDSGSGVVPEELQNKIFDSAWKKNYTNFIHTITHHQSH